MKKITLIAASGLLFILLVVSGFPFIGGYGAGVAMAVDFDKLLENYTDEYIRSDEENMATKETAASEVPRNYIYEESSVKNLSHLFWAVGLYKYEDEEAIKEFLRINECEIYKNYFNNELELQEIIEATRGFLRDNKYQFPTRFEFMLPLKLSDYSAKRKAFEIQDSYKIESLRRFELYATDYRLGPCMLHHKIHLGYPRALVMEFSRPLTLAYVPMSQKVANDYMQERMDFLERRWPGGIVTQYRVYESREAYLLLKVKIFTHGKMLRVSNRGIPVVQMFGALEGFEVYNNKEKDVLFYAENYVTSQNKGKLNEQLKEQYELLLKKHKGEGVFQ